MKKLIITCFLLWITGMGTSQTLTGEKNIPSDYLTIQAAIAALNTNGAGPGGVIFNVNANHTETLTSFNSGTITATGTATDSIVFRKNPLTTGSNPKITSFVISASSATDGIIKITGGDYITFDGIDLEENTSNVLTSRMTEWGYALVKKQNYSPFDGCQHVTIRNCTITLNKANVSSVGIYSGNHIATSTSLLSLYARTDACNNCLFENNTISNVYTGVSMNGFNALTPYTLFDHNNCIGLAGKNRIFNFGGAGSASYGVFATCQDSLRVMNDSIVSGSGTASIIAGVYFQTGPGSSAEIAGNYISVSRSTTNGSNLYGIWNQAGGNPSQNTIKIHDNIIKNCNQPVTTTGNLYGIYNTGGADTIRIYNNELVGSTYSGTASHFGIRSDASGTVQFIHDNTIHQLSNSSTGGLTLIYTASFATSNCFSNDLHDCSGNGGTVYGLYTTTTPAWNVYKNNLNNLSSNNGSTATCLVHGIYNQGGTTANIYNNFVTGLNTSAGTNNLSITGINIAGGTTSNVYYNTVYLNGTSTGSTFGSAALYASTTPVMVLRNNILVNTSAHGTSGYTVAYRRSGVSLTSYSSASNNNCFYAGVPGPNNLIFYNGTASDQTFSAYQARVAPRDALSFSENPPFAEAVTPPYNLHLLTTIPTYCESGAAIITTPGITTDIDDDMRFPNTGYPNHISYNASAPDVGADEFGGIPNDLTPPVFSYLALKNTSSLLERTLTVSITDAQSGVPTALPGLPVLYWKINDAATWNSSVATHLGGDQYSFTFGNGVALSDVVYYYLCAQDGFLTPNVAVSPSDGAEGLTYSPPACSIPPGPPHAYRIVGTLPAGNYLIGGTGNTPSPGCSYVDITQAFADVNNVVDRIEVTNGGSGYGLYSTYVVIAGGGGSGALAEAVIDEFGAVTAILVTRNGDGYYMAPTVVITGDGSNATAVAYIGAGKEVTGMVNFLLDASYQSGEENAFPLHLEPFIGAGPGKTISLKPAPSTTHTIYSNTGAGVIKLNGVDYFTLDGSNNGSTSRDLTLHYLAGSINSAMVWIASATSTDGATNNTVKNLVIKGSGPGTLTYAGIFSGGGVSIESNFFAQAANSNNTLENNEIFWARNGIVALGKSTVVLDEGLVIKNNLLGTEVSGEGFTNQGIFMENQDGGLVSGNHIQNIIYNSQHFWVAGVYLANSRNMNISGNKIHQLRQAAAGASYWVDGIYQAAPAFNTFENPSGNLYANNVIYDLTSNGESSYYNVIGIHNAQGRNDKYYYNSVYLSGQLNQYGSSNGGMSACFSNGQGVNSTYATNIELKNNVFYINSDNPSGVNHHYAHYTVLSTYAGSVLDYNLMYENVTGTAIGHIGYFNNTSQDDLVQWQAATLQDNASVSADPLFTSAINLEPLAGSPVLGAGIPVPGTTIDFNGVPRDVLHPSIGAYESVAVSYKLWNGTVSADWSEGANWTPSGVPLASDDLVIPSATPFTCTLNSTGLASNSVTINTGAVLILQISSELTVFEDFKILNGGTLTNDGLMNLKGNFVNQNSTK